MSARGGSRGTRVTVHLGDPLDGAGLDALARLALVVRRAGWRLEVAPGGPDGADPLLDPLLDLSGIVEVLRALELPPRPA